MTYKDGWFSNKNLAEAGLLQVFRLFLFVQSLLNIFLGAVRSQLKNRNTSAHINSVLFQLSSFQLEKFKPSLKIINNPLHVLLGRYESKSYYVRTMGPFTIDVYNFSRLPMYLPLVHIRLRWNRLHLKLTIPIQNVPTFPFSNEKSQCIKVYF